MNDLHDRLMRLRIELDSEDTLHGLHDALLEIDDRLRVIEAKLPAPRERTSDRHLAIERRAAEIAADVLDSKVFFTYGMYPAETIGWNMHAELPSAGGHLSGPTDDDAAAGWLARQIVYQVDGKFMREGDEV